MFSEPSATDSLQAVHEIRHKRHIPGLYRRGDGVLEPGGIFVRMGIASKFGFCALGVSLVLLSGCSSEECLGKDGSFDVRIENGAYQEICAYAVRARPTQGKSFDLPGVVEGTDCRCSGGDRTGTFEVALDGDGSNEFAVQLEPRP